MSLNLLPTQAKFQAEKIRLKEKVSKIMVWASAVWIFVIVGIFITNFVVGFFAKSATNQYEKAMENFLGMKNEVQTSQDLKYNAKLVGGSLNSRFEYGKAFELIQSLFPVGIELKTYQLRDKGLFEISGSTAGKNNVDILEKIVEDINKGQKDRISSCKISSLSIKDGMWLFTMEVTIK